MLEAGQAARGGEQRVRHRPHLLRDPVQHPLPHRHHADGLVAGGDGLELHGLWHEAAVSPQKLLNLHRWQAREDLGSAWGGGGTFYLLPQCTVSNRQIGVVYSTDHVLSNDSRNSDIGRQGELESEDDDVLFLEASQELFAAACAEPLVITLGDD